jgi:hypothetical protein
VKEGKLPADPVKTGQAWLGLPGNVDMITGSALTPVLESVAALPAGLPADLPVNHVPRIVDKVLYNVKGGLWEFFSTLSAFASSW